MLFGHLQIVLGRDHLGVADPCANHVDWVRLRQLRFPRGTQIVKKFWPRRQARPPDNSEELGAEVLIGLAVAVYDMNGSGLGEVKRFLEGNAQLGEKRNPPFASSS
jgi:hypothetical protein